MTFQARVLADSQHPYVNSRLTTMELTYPRCIHSEVMTHRMFARNSASSRAIPVERMIARVERSPFVPIYWGTNKAGMQAGEEHEDQAACEQAWLSGAEEAVGRAHRLNRLGLHKQIVNRVLEPYLWHTTIVTGLEHAWRNFFKLRCHPDAEPHINRIATIAQTAYRNRWPMRVPFESWHLPLTGFPGDNALTPDELRRVSVARCARVSYLTHDGRRDVDADFALYDRLKASGHWSPFEHVARPVPGNSLGITRPFWKTCRDEQPGEYDYSSAE